MEQRDASPADFISLRQATEMGREEAIELQKAHQNHVRMDMALQLGAAQQFVRAGENGVELFEADGTRHLDFIGGVSVMAVGNANRRVWEALEAVKDAPAMHATAIRSTSAALAANLAALSGGSLEKVWLGSSGAEAAEGAIKLCKMAFQGERHRFVSVENAYHGKTTGALSLTRKKWALHQHPLMPGVETVPLNDVPALEEALSGGDVAGFFIEPIQGEAGIHVASEDYLQAVRELCSHHGTLLACDEIQCGIGRTGKLWAHQHAGIEPDIILFAKGISGGYVPLSGYICTREAWDRAYGTPETAFHHTATYQNNGLACAAGIAVLEELLGKNLMEAADEKGRYLLDGLHEIAQRHGDVIEEVRGKGLMIGVEFGGGTAEEAEAFAAGVASTLMHTHRIQTLFSINNPTVIRALPPLTVSHAQLDEFLTAFAAAVEEVKVQA